MRFAKGHGTENDFVLLFDPDGTTGLSAELARRLCDRRAGIGADGVLRVVRTAALATPGEAGGPRAEWFMDYRNADGSLAEMCGNGVRVFARYLAVHGLAAGPEFPVATRSGSRLVRIRDSGAITVDMGPAVIVGSGPVTVDGEAWQGIAVSIGNPHCVCLTGRPLDSFTLAVPPVPDPGVWPEGANVELVRRSGPASLAMRVHERGSGETRSCGTGAVAAAAAAAQQAGSAEPEWRVRVPGGELTVTLDGTTSWLTGPAVIVAEGELDPAWLS